MAKRLSGYYEIERVIDKELYDRAFFRAIERMSGTQHDPRILAIVRPSKDLYPLVYFTSTDAILNSPLKGANVSAYLQFSATPQVVADLKEIGVKRIACLSQYTGYGPAGDKPGFDTEGWFRHYTAFRNACAEHDIDLYVSRLIYSGYFLCRIDNGGFTDMILASQKKVKLTSVLDDNYRFPRTLGYATHGEYITDHIRPEAIQLMADADMAHVAGWCEHEGERLLVVKTSKISKPIVKKSKSWSIIKWREPIRKKKGMAQ